MTSIPVSPAATEDLSLKVEFFRHNLEEQDIDSLSTVLRSVFITTGPVTSEFEKKFARYVKSKDVVALNSCTAALHLSLAALGIGPGDEVITTPMTFIATATAIIQAGATPVLVDVEAETALMDINRVEEAITPRTKAIIPVHLYGSMVDMRALRQIADHYDIRIVEDCAHCIEGERDGSKPGSLGDLACYSFYATKNLSCGEGGAVATNDPQLAQRIRLLRNHGMTKDAATRYTGKYQHWDMAMMGWKYNMDDIHAALLIKQIERLDAYWSRRQEISMAYDSQLAEIPDIEIPKTRGKSARHLYTIWVNPDSRDEILTRLQQKGIGVAVNYRAIHTLTFFKETFRYQPDDYPAAYRIGQRTLSLPLYPKLKDDEIAYITLGLKELYDR